MKKKLTSARGRTSIRKGREAENDVVAFLKGAGYRLAERRRLSGDRDTGDIAGIPRLILDVKNRRNMDMSAALDDLIRKVRAASGDGLITEAAAVVFKRSRRPTAEWYAIMPLTFLLSTWGHQPITPATAEGSDVGAR